jgi:hypothetical protein
MPGEWAYGKVEMNYYVSYDKLRMGIDLAFPSQLETSVLKKAAGLKVGITQMGEVKE